MNIVQEQKVVPVFATWSDFHPYYMLNHQDHNNRRLHFLGSSLAIIWFLYMLLIDQFRHPSRILYCLVSMYRFAFLGHLWYEQKPPSGVDYPLWSMYSGWYMWFDIARGNLEF